MLSGSLSRMAPTTLARAAIDGEEMAETLALFLTTAHNIDPNDAATLRI